MIVTGTKPPSLSAWASRTGARLRKSSSKMLPVNTKTISKVLAALRLVVSWVCGG